MKKSFFTICMLLWSMASLLGQAMEICNNGIDDDNDSFIDCEDANCNLSGINGQVDSISIISNTPVVCNTQPTALSVAINGQIGQTPGVSYSWSDGSTSQTIVAFFASTYVVTATRVGGCSASTFFTLQSSPPISINIISSCSTVNQNTGVLTAQVNGGIQPYFYNWSNGALSPTIGNLQAGFYTLTVTDAFGCFETITGTVSDCMPIAADDSFSTNVNNPFTGDVAINDTFNGNISVYGASGTPTNGTVTFNGQGVFVYTPNFGYSGIDSFEYVICQPNSGFLNCDSAWVSINIIPCNIGATIISNTGSSLCSGSTATLEAFSTGGSMPYNYAWSTGSTTSILPQISTAGTYSVTITDSNGCAGDAIFSLTAVQSPQAFILADTICEGEDGVLNVSYSSNPTSTSISWSGGQSGNTAIYSNLGPFQSPYNFNATVIDQSTGCSVITTGEIVVNARPTISIIASPATVCDGDSVTLIASGTGSSYLWNTTDTIPTIQIVPSANNVYIVSATIGDCVDSASIIVTVLPIPTVSFLPYWTSTMPIDTMYMINNSGIGTSGGQAGYFWDFGDGEFSTDPFPTHVFAHLGIYNVCLTITDLTTGCSNIICENIGMDSLGNIYYNGNPNLTNLGNSPFTLVMKPPTIVNVDNLEDYKILSVSPNPTESFLNISHNLTGSLSLNIYDILGNCIVEKNLENLSSEIQNEILDTSTLPQGIYVISINNNKYRKSLKFVKI